MVHLRRSSVVYKVNIACEEKLAAHHPRGTTRNPSVWSKLLNTSSVLFLKTPWETPESMGHTKYYTAHLSHLTTEKNCRITSAFSLGYCWELHEHWMGIKYCSSTTVIFKIRYFLHTVKFSVCSDFNALYSVSQIIHTFLLFTADIQS